MNGTMLTMLFQQGVLYRRSQVSAWAVYLLWAGMALLLVGALAFGLVTANWQFFPKLAVFSIGFLTCVEWSALAKVAPVLNNPSNAWLVPGARRRAMRVIAITWALVVLLLGAMLGYLFGGYPKWMGLVAIALSGIALLGISRWEGLLIYLAAIFVGLDIASLPFLGQGWPLAGLLAGALLCAVYAMAQMFPRGERHWRNMANIEKNQKKPGGQIAAPGAANIAGTLQLGYRWLLERDCRHGRSSGRLLWHVLGPSAHWSAFVTGVVLLFALFGLGLTMTDAFDNSLDFALGVMAGVSVPALLIGQVAYASQIVVRLHATATEQCLLMLTPRMPQHGEPNRLFVRQVLLHSAVMFGVGLAVAAFHLVINGASASVAIKVLSWTCVTSLLPASVLRWATRTTNPANVWPAMVALLQMVALIVVFMLFNAKFDLPISMLGLASLLLASLMLWRDAGRVLRGPAVLPMARA